MKQPDFCFEKSIVWCVKKTFRNKVEKLSGGCCPCPEKLMVPGHVVGLRVGRSCQNGFGGRARLIHEAGRKGEKGIEHCS